MKKWIIGMTPRLTDSTKYEQTFVHQRYLRPLNERGAIPILLPLENEDIEDILNVCDAFLVTGGNDINPVFYNETNENSLSRNIDARLDAIDRVVVEHAFRRQVPLFGICRGHQSINVFLGGSLHQDLAELAINHGNIERNQSVKIIGGSLFSSILPPVFDVNSYHHQAVKRLAPGMIASIVSEDGVIEAIEHEILPIFSVQWHPEMIMDTSESNLLYDKFIELIHQKAGSR